MAWLENIFHTIGSSPLFMVVGVLLLFVLLLSAVLRVAKLALLAGLLLVVYVAYLHFSGGAIPNQLKNAEQVLEDSVKTAGRALQDNAEAAGRAVQKTAKKVGQRLEQGISQPASASGRVTGQEQVEDDAGQGTGSKP